MSEFKVGEFVRIKNCGGGQPESMAGKILPIIHVIKNGGNIRIKDPTDVWEWTFIRQRVEPVYHIHTGRKFLQGKFVMPDGTPGIVDVNIRGNVTQVTIIVDPQEEYHACNKNKQFFGGVAFCNPCDKFDINTGIKEACKKALFSDWDLTIAHPVYSAIRKAMRGETE